MREERAEVSEHNNYEVWHNNIMTGWRWSKSRNLRQADLTDCNMRQSDSVIFPFLNAINVENYPAKYDQR